MPPPGFNMVALKTADWEKVKALGRPDLGSQFPGLGSPQDD